MVVHSFDHAPMHGDTPTIARDAARAGGIAVAATAPLASEPVVPGHR